MTRLADGELLAEAIKRDPLSWLGATHVQRYGSNTLLKLLDAGQRLPVHAHPGMADLPVRTFTPQGADAW